MTANGRVPGSDLEWVSSVQLAKPTAAAFRAMALACVTETGLVLTIVRPAGGYRDLFVQGDMKDRPWLYNLNPASVVSIAAPGYSTHGLGTAVDISSMTGRRKKWVLENMHRFGFTRPFGENDPNHLHHNGTAPAGPPPQKGWLMALTDKQQDDLYARIVTIDERLAKVDTRTSSTEARTKLTHKAVTTASKVTTTINGRILLLLRHFRIVK